MCVVVDLFVHSNLLVQTRGAGGGGGMGAIIRRKAYIHKPNQISNTGFFSVKTKEKNKKEKNTLKISTKVRRGSTLVPQVCLQYNNNDTKYALDWERKNKNKNNNNNNNNDKLSSADQLFTRSHVPFERIRFTHLSADAAGNPVRAKAGTSSSSFVSPDSSTPSMEREKKKPTFNVLSETIFLNGKRIFSRSKKTY